MVNTSTMITKLDTPRTDAIWFKVGADERAIAFCDLARQLERELAEITRELEECKITYEQRIDYWQKRTAKAEQLLEEARDNALEEEKGFAETVSCEHCGQRDYVIMRFFMCHACRDDALEEAARLAEARIKGWSPSKEANDEAILIGSTIRAMKGKK